MVIENTTQGTPIKGGSVKKEPSRRQLQVGEEVRFAISNYLIRNNITILLGHLITINKVLMSPDLKSCKVYLSILGSKENEESTRQSILAQMELHTKSIKNTIKKSVILRYMPEIRFYFE